MKSSRSSTPSSSTDRRIRNRSITQLRRCRLKTRRRSLPSLLNIKSQNRLYEITKRSPCGQSTSSLSADERGQSGSGALLFRHLYKTRRSTSSLNGSYKIVRRSPSYWSPSSSSSDRLTENRQHRHRSKIRRSASSFGSIPSGICKRSASNRSLSSSSSDHSRTQQRKNQLLLNVDSRQRSENLYNGEQISNDLYRRTCSSWMVDDSGKRSQIADVPNSVCHIPNSTGPITEAEAIDCSQPVCLDIRAQNNKHQSCFVPIAKEMTFPHDQHFIEEMLKNENEFFGLEDTSVDLIKFVNDYPNINKKSAEFSTGVTKRNPIERFNVNKGEHISSFYVTVIKKRLRTSI